MSSPLGLLRLTRSLLNRASRRRRENAAGSDPDFPRKLSPGAPLIFETLEPRLLLAADPLGINAGYAFDEVLRTAAADASHHCIVGTLTNVDISGRAGTTGVEFAGRIDDMRIANHAQDQIQTDMVTPLAAAAPNATFAAAAVDAAPTVALTAPAANATVRGTVTVSATASDDVGVAGVQFLLDAAALGTEDTTSPYSLSWNTATAANETHVLSAVARDAAGNTAVATVSVTVDNQAPTGTVLINGDAAATNNRTVTLTLSAADALSGVTQMRFSNTGTSFSTAEAYATTKTWTLSSSAGTKTVYVQFKDAVGNWSTLPITDTIVLDTTAPTISARTATSITTNSSTITWTTNEPATSRVEYGLTTSYGSTTLLDPALVTAHSVLLTGLASNTTYNYRVRSVDAAGNERVSANSTFRTAVGTDTIAPTVQSINRVGTAPTNAATVSWTVLFSENVTAVDASDFTLVTTGAVTGATITTVSGSGNQYTVTANTGTGNGTLGLNLVDNDTIRDTSANPLGGPGVNGNFTGQSYTIDKTQPSVTINQAAGQADPTNTSPINFTVTFSETVTGFTASDISFAGSTVGGTLTAAVTGTGPTYNVAVSGMTGTGTVVASVPAGAATDAAGNASLASTSTDNTVAFNSVDTIAPTVQSINRVGTTPTNAASVSWTVLFSESVTAVDASDFTLVTTGAVTGATITTVSGSGSQYTVTANTGTGNGTLGLNLVDNDTILDTSANPLGGPGLGNGNFTGQSYTIDKTRPSVTINQAAGQADLTNTSPINFTVTFSETVANFATGDVTLSGTAGATTATVTGSGTTYNVAVTGMTGSGTIIATVAAGVASDAAGNASLVSTSTDNTVTYNVSSASLFQNEILATGFNLPTAIKFLPDGSMLVVELGGTIKVLPPPYTQALPTSFLQLTNVGHFIDGSGGAQQGVYDVALDPNFTTNHYYYIFYTAETPNHDRLSRFTANSTLTGTDLATELILYEDPQDADGEHHGGAINFGNDGKIYVTTGEHFQGAPAQDLTSPRGKILRINPDGTVPTDNPFYDGSGPNYDAIWALGLRNPYRAYYDAPTGRLLIGDVGGNNSSTAIEELNVGMAGANYGWPNVEGPSNNPAYTNPIYSYAHNGRDAAITGGFVYHGTQFPSSYQGSYFFADYAQNWIKRLTFDANGNVNGVFNFEPADGAADGPSGDIVYLTEGPEGALYYVDLGFSDTTGEVGVSKIRRISYEDPNNLPPVVSATATPTGGPPPLTVTFSSAGSSDPEGRPLSYSWNFGDGSAISTEANPTHTYNTAGPYQARLTVSDGVYSTLSTPLSISVGDRPVITTFSTTPSDGGLFRAGDVISFSATATDGGVPLPASAYTWNIDFLHEGHVHPGSPISGQTGGTFTIPTSGHDFSGNTRYRITLTVTDSDGLQSSQSATVYPEKVNLTFNTAPAGLTLYLDGIAHTGPFVYDTLIGFNHTIEARNQTIGTNTYNFVSWSDGGTQQHTIGVPDVAPQPYTANYDVVFTPAPIAFVQVNAATPQTNQSAVTVAYTSAQVAGDTNILAIGWNNTTSTITSVTDSAGNTYQLAVPTASGSGISQAIYYAKNIKAAAAGTNTVTVTFSASTPFVDIRALEYSGLDPVNPFDVGTSASGSGTSANSGTVTTSAARELIFGAGMTVGVFSAAGTNFTNRIITAQDGDIAEDRFVTTTGSYSATASVSAAWVMQVATFRAAGAGGADTIAPTVTINQATTQADPTSASPINFTVTFSETVANFATGDVTLSGTAGATTATVTGSGTTYNVAVTGMTASGTVIATVAAGVASDAAGNLSLGSTSTDNTVVFNSVDTAPTVQSINRVGTTPTNAASVSWTVLFSESVTGVDASHFTLVTTGAVTGATITTVSGSGSQYTVTANTGTGDGTLGLNLVDNDTILDTSANPLGGTGLGNGNFTGQSYTIDKTRPSVTINQAAGQADPTNTSPINFTVTFSETVANFATGDVTLSGTAGATTATVTGSGTTYNVAVTGMTASGTVIATVAAGVASDAAGNLSLGSTSTDNTVAYNVSTPAPIAFVQVNAATPQTNQTAVTVAYTSAQVAGDTNILAIGWNNTTSTITSVTDSAGNTYQLAVPTASGSGISQAIYYAKNIKAAAAGTNTVTVTFSASTPFVDIRALEYSGLDPVNPFDVGTSASGSGTSANSGTVTTGAAGELIFGAGITTGVFSAAGANFTNRIITAPDGDIAEDRFVTTTGSYSATASLSGSAAWVMQVATFRAATSQA